MRRHPFRQYVAFARVGFREARAERGELYGRVAFLLVILGIFSALWRAAGEAVASVAENPRTLLFYLATTEWILLSAPQIHFQIEADVRRGDIAYQVGRPVSYVGSLFAQAVGMLAVRSPLLLLASASSAWLFAGGLPSDLSRFLYAIPLGFAASVVLIALNLTIGICAFWFDDIAPLHWILQKLSFVLGGLMLPLPLYPQFLARVAAFTPFPALLYGPASFVFEATPAHAFRLSLELAAWFAVIATIGTALFRRAAATLQLNGG